MKGLRLASIAAAAIAPALMFAAPAHADPDTDFANELHTYGIYGQKDYNAWIGKIACKRLYNAVDQDADKSAKFVFVQLPKGSTTEQAWQFLAAALRTYCPEQTPVLQRAAGQE
jgi:beta-glucanase (GH16 family)